MRDKRLEQLGRQRRAEQDERHGRGNARATADQSHTDQHCPQEQARLRVDQFGDVIGQGPEMNQMSEPVERRGVTHLRGRHERCDHPRQA
jgi:hypothetical protein